MDSGPDGGGFWQKLTSIFNKNEDNIEQSILEASQDGELEAAEGKMLLSILHLNDLKVEDIMTPRTDITAAEAETCIQKAITAILESGHSRLPIYQENLDNIVGVTYAKDLLKEVGESANLAKPVKTIMRHPFFVPETKNVVELLNEFRAKKTHLAVILDEYGGTSGLVTIEDVLEEIVGEIEDEHDAPKAAEIVMREDGAALLSGRAYLEDINKALGVNLDSDEVDTIGGLLSHIAGMLPRPRDIFDLGAMRFEVLEADNKQVRKVLARPLTPEELEEAAEREILD